MSVTEPIGRPADRPVDRRVAFRDRCIALARDAGSAERTAELFLLDVPMATAERDDHAAAPHDGASDEPAKAAGARLLIVPGLLGDTVRSLVAPLMCARDGLRAEGRDIEVAWLNGRAGCTRNAVRLRALVLEAADASGAPIDLVGYSKGCADALHMLGDWPDTHAALRSLVSLGGVVHGTPLARDAPPLAARALRRLALPGRGRGDGRAIADLTPAFRRRWFEEHALPADIRYASIVATPSPERVSRVLRPSWRALARHDPCNDSQVSAGDALLPGGELLATLNADHWALALPIAERSAWLARLAVTCNDFPRTVMLKGLMDHLAEPVL